MSSARDLVVFALNTSRCLGEAVSDRLDRPLAEHEERTFGGGEHKARALVEIDGRDVYVLHGLHGEPHASANDKLVQLLFFIGALKDAGAGRVTAICPYFAYSRNDRRTKPRDPVASRYVAQLFESVRLDRIVTVDVHNISAFENAFRHCRAVNVPLARLLARHIAAQPHVASLTVMSPDIGGSKRAELLRRELEERLAHPVAKAIMDKHRSNGLVSGSLFAGNVEGRTVIIFDDLISTGGTILRAVDACRKAGASHVIAAAAHGLFTTDIAIIGADGPDELILSDTVPLPETLRRADNITELPVAGLLAEMIKRLHDKSSLSELLPYA